MGGLEDPAAVIRYCASIAFLTDFVDSLTKDSNFKSEKFYFLRQGDCVRFGSRFCGRCGFAAVHGFRVP